MLQRERLERFARGSAFLRRGGLPTHGGRERVEESSLGAPSSALADRR